MHPLTVGFCVVAKVTLICTIIRSQFDQLPSQILAFLCIKNPTSINIYVPKACNTRLTLHSALWQNLGM